MGWALVVGVCAGTPWLTRALLLHEKRLPLRLVDLRGAMADLSVGLLVVAVVGLCLQIRRWWARAAAIAILIAVVVSSFGMYEFISVFDSLYAFSHMAFLGDATFVGGSARHLQHPVWLALMALAAVVGGASAGAPARRGWLVWGVTLVCCVGIQWLVPSSDAYDEWRQRHALEANLAALAEPVSAGPETVGAELRELLRGDLRGRPWVEPLGPATNVLLIMLEGASGAYLPSVAATQGVQTSTVMPKLDALARRNTLFGRVIAHQRQTNRAEYGILCGEYPKLLTDQSKMSEQTYGAARRCLPAVLRDAGYATVYIQAAPLGFMLKDQFMPRAGFEELIGEPWFGRAYARSDWGVDDKAFFEQALVRILQLHGESRPFFATLLTVGTHHPYTIPDFASFPEPSVTQAATRHDLAFRWADEAVASFVSKLREHGVLEDTVVLITSDESSGLADALNPTQRLLSQSWSFVIAMLPGQESRRIETLVEHVDTAISVTDLLGLEHEAPHFIGRSWFRQYDGGRPAFSGNTYARTVMMWEPTGAVVICDESLRECSRFVADGGLVFGARGRREPASAREQRLLAEMARLSRSGRGDLSESGTLALLSNAEARVRAEEGKKLLIGGQYLRVSGGSTLHIELDLEVEGTGAVVEFHQDTFLDGYPQMVRKGVWVSAGERWHFSYEIGVVRDASQLVVQLYAQTVSGEEATIRFRRAELTMAQRAEQPTEQALILVDDRTEARPPRP